MTAKIRPLGILVLLVGAWGALVPFVGPLFGYNMGNLAAWTWSESHFSLHLLPGAVAAVGGLLMLRSAAARVRTGAILGLLGGAWFILGPTFHPAWAGGSGTMMMGSNVWSGILSSFGYHYGPGVVLTVLSAFALGALNSQARSMERRPPVTSQYEQTKQTSQDMAASDRDHASVT